MIHEASLRILRDVASDSILVVDWVLGQTVRYLVDVEGLRPDVEVVVMPEKEGLVPPEEEVLAAIIASASSSDAANGFSIST